MENKEKQITVNLSEGTKELIIRHGEAEIINEPIMWAIGGQIDAPTRFIENRINKFNSVIKVKCIFVIDREKLSITFFENPENEKAKIITGKLELTKEFKEFGINSSKSYTTHELSDFIKMNRYHFEKKEIAMKRVTELRNFKGRVERDIEKMDDRRGNRRDLEAQVINSNIPESFKVNLPIFKGQLKETIEVEVEITSNFECFLISPDANDLINTYRDTLIDEQVKKIKEVSDDLLIIEV